jgi:Arc/MetJ-type ribon-helix-helix transcriptional regulator
VTTQIAVRLSDELVKQLDVLVAEGRYRSRATAVERALARELRRALAVRDLEILERSKDEPDPDDLAGFLAWTEANPVPLD